MVKQKKSMYWRNLWKSIFASKARFLSIFSIVFLGAAFFAGLRNTPGTMTKTMDAYLDKHNYSDLTYIASLGFSQDDIAAIKDIEGIDKIEYGYQFDALKKTHDQLEGVKVYTSQTFDTKMINHPDLIEGRFLNKVMNVLLIMNLQNQEQRLVKKLIFLINKEKNLLLL